jgi:hypothetical protein
MDHRNRRKICHKKTPCIAILKEQKCHFFTFTKIKEQEGRTGPVWGTGINGREWRYGKGMGG